MRNLELTFVGGKKRTVEDVSLVTYKVVGASRYLVYATHLGTSRIDLTCLEDHFVYVV